MPAVQPPIQNPQNQSSVAEQLAAAQLRVLLREEEKLAQDQEVKRRFAESAAKQAAEERRKLEKSQEDCGRRGNGHSKDNGQRATFTTRVAGGKYITVCQNCSKIWHDMDSVPPHLRLSQNEIGGSSA